MSKNVPPPPPKPRKSNTNFTPIDIAIQEVLNEKNEDRIENFSRPPPPPPPPKKISALNNPSPSPPPPPPRVVTPTSEPIVVEAFAVPENEDNYQETTYSATTNPWEDEDKNLTSNSPISSLVQNTSVSSSSSSTSLTMTNSNPTPPPTHMNMTPTLGEGDPDNLIYNLISFSDLWMFIFIVLHIGQFTTMIISGFDMIPKIISIVLIILMVVVIALCIYARYFIKTSKLTLKRNLDLKGGVCTPEDEADDIPSKSIYVFALVCIIEGFMFALYASYAAGNKDESGTGFYAHNTSLQIIRFASITLLALHRILRPANRIDPMVNILELEVVSVCWDAIDGSTLYELLNVDNLSDQMTNAIRALMIVWYLSVGFRMSIMMITNLKPRCLGYRLFLTDPLQLAPQPTVDRTLQGLRLRSIVLMTMGAADFFAAIIRIILWSNNKLDSIQQDMAIKNITFLMSCSGAYSVFQNTITRQWNNRNLLTWPFKIRMPSRRFQFIFCRWAFVVSYLLLSSLFTYILVQVSDSNLWIFNIIPDCVLCLVFIIYCKNINIKADLHEPKYFKPKESFFTFPTQMLTVIGILLFISLFIARIPGLFLNSDNMEESGSGEIYTYDNSLLLVSISFTPIAFYSLYWAYGYMLFRKEFTASPDNYNAIHDPALQVITVSNLTEGALDVLACSTLMALATTQNLPSSVDYVIIIFCLLELFNAGQSMTFQCKLSGGHDDTPRDLVEMNARLRMSRLFVNTGSLLLRIILWTKYNAVSSVFLVKNIYNIIHTLTTLQKWSGVKRYPNGILFSEFVSPQDWYGLSKEQWRYATSKSLVDQARSGRGV